MSGLPMRFSPVYTLLWVGGSETNRGGARCTASRAWQTQPEAPDLRSSLDSDSSDRKSSGPPGYFLMATRALELSAFQSDSSDSCRPVQPFFWLEIPVLVFHRPVLPLHYRCFPSVALRPGNLRHCPPSRPYEVPAGSADENPSRRNCYSQLLPIACCWTCSTT